MTETATISDPERRKLFSRLFELLTRRAARLVPNSYDRDVYLFIADRSFTFGKLSKDIPDRWFLDGVTGKGNTRGHRAGLSMKRAQLYKSRKVLKDRGLVRDQKVGRCKRYAIALEPVWPLLSAEEREFFAPLLTLVDPVWKAEEKAERVHSVDVQQVHAVDPHLEKRVLLEESKRSARTLAPDADRGASPFSEEKRASAPVKSSQAAAPSVAIQAAPPTATPPVPIEVVPAAPLTVKVVKRGRVPRELWGSTLSDRFDAAFREAWPDAELPPEASIKLRKQWEQVATRWRRTDIAPGDWIEWCVKHWRTTYQTVFRHVELAQNREAEWRDKAPWLRKRQWREDVVYSEYPDLDFLRKYRAAFEREYDRRDSQMLRTDLLPGAKLLRQLLREGWPPEDAQRQVDARLAKRKFVEDLDKRAREINEAARRLELEKQDPEYRLALVRIRSGRDPAATWVKPVALAKPQAKVRVIYEIEDLPPLVSSWPEWKDPEECSCTA
ncbi:hypothetical protein MKK64_04595 [Methylobacterium sp. E-025]|uniref:hypothetical protein n=1 Tax=Methylobacterium sp. E-025 TaxID=2836561 RepID=UPI001FB9C700|nr:hypothetical protein [Methylobacterium sp. E-025]MCJ2110492.1 hypothetical protein [Methylobacterium sp. E-025]